MYLIKEVTINIIFRVNGTRNINGTKMIKVKKFKYQKNFFD